MQLSLRFQYQPSYLNGVIKSASLTKFFTETNTRRMPLDASTPQAPVLVQHQSNLRLRSIACWPQRRCDNTKRSYASDVASQATLQQHAKVHHLTHQACGAHSKLIEAHKEGEDHPGSGDHPSSNSNNNINSTVRHPSEKV